MADPFNTPVGQAVLQGAQVFNQSVQVFLQDQRARQHLELRRKELEDLARVREQRMKHESDVLKMKEEKLALEQELISARTDLLTAQAVAEPIKAAAAGQRAGAQIVSAEASKQRAETGAMKAEADIILRARGAELKEFKAEFSKLHTLASQRPLPKELKPLEPLSLEQLEKRSMNLAQAISRAMAEEVFFPEEQQARIGALREEMNKVNQAIKYRTAEMSAQLPAMKFGDKANAALEKILHKMSTSYPSNREAPVTPPPPRTSFDFQFPEAASVQDRAQTVAQQVQTFGRLTEESVSQEDLEELANEVFALGDYPQHATIIKMIWEASDFATFEKFKNMLGARRATLAARQRQQIKGATEAVRPTAPDLRESLRQKLKTIPMR